MITFTSGCDYLVVCRDSTAIEFKVWDTQGGIRIEVPPTSGNMEELVRLTTQHGGWRSITFLRCPPTP